MYTNNTLSDRAIDLSKIDLRTLPTRVKNIVSKTDFPANYQAAKTALKVCIDIDECKDWENKTTAMAVYAKQIRDPEMEAMAKKIKLQAMVRLGEILLTFPPTPTRGNRDGTRNVVAASKGISIADACRYAAMARVEKKIRDPLIEAKVPIHPRVLTSMGRVGFSSGHSTSSAYKAIISKEQKGSLGMFVTFISRLDPKEYAHLLRKDEAKILRKHFAKIQEWCDEMDQRMPK